MAAKIQNDLRLKQYETTVADFATKEGGYFLTVSDDHVFVNVVRVTLAKHLALGDSSLSTIQDEERILRIITDTSLRKKQFVLFIEQFYRGKDTSFLIRQIRNTFDNVRIIVLTGETDRQHLILLHEIGADNFITKPISVNTLIEKIAFTIKPQGKIGRFIDQAKSLLASGSYEDCLKVCRQVLELKPNSAAALIVMGDAWKALGRKDRAEQCYSTASEHAPMYMEPLKKLAGFYLEEQVPEKRLECLERLDALSPLNAERKVEMGEVHLSLGNADTAESFFDMALEQATAEAGRYIGEISSKIADLYKDSKPEIAEKYYRHSLEARGGNLGPTDIATFNQLGMSLRRQGKWQEAVAEYGRALKIAPEDENLFYNTALAYAEAKRGRDAYHNLLTALRLNPGLHRSDASVCYNAAVICYRVKEFAKALAFAEQLLELEPDSRRARELIARIREAA